MSQWHMDQETDERALRERLRDALRESSSLRRENEVLRSKLEHYGAFETAKRRAKYEELKKEFGE